MSFAKLANRDAFGKPIRSQSIFEAKLDDIYFGGIAKWTLGNTVADKFGGYTLTNTGVTFVDEATYPNGARKVASFNGSNNYLSHATIAAFDFGTGDFSIHVKYYSDTTSGDHVILAAGGYGGSGSTSGYTLYGRGDRVLFCTTDGSTWPSGRLEVVSLAASQWRDVFLVRSGTTVSMYVNLSLAGSTTFSGVISSRGLPLYIGREHSAANYFVGKIASVAVYARALSSVERSFIAGLKY